MTSEETVEIVGAIIAAYPRFEIDEKRFEVWVKALLPMDFKKVKMRLDEHIVTKPFPPAIAEIAAFPKPENEYLKQWEQWKKEGAKRIEEQRNKPKPRNPFS